MGATVELFGVDGSHYVLAGDGAGDDGIYLGTDPQGLYDSPVTVTSKSGAFEIGGKPTKVTRRIREVMLPLGAYAYTPDDWAEADSKIRKAFDYEVDPWDPDATPTRLRVTTDESGSRDLFLLMTESPVMDLSTDPHDYEHSLLPVVCAAHQPDWFEPPVISPVHWLGETTPGELPGTSGEGTVWIENPTPLPMMHTWVISGQGTVALPDFSWTGPKYARVPGVDLASGKDDSERMLTLTPLTEADGGGAVVEVDRMKIPIRNKAGANGEGSNIAGRMGGRRLLHKVPPYTPPTQLPVWATAAQPGLRVELIMKRLWPRPWGLE